jgi:flagellar hook-length control protein FliK
MMADNGITLGNVTVDANASQQQKDTWQQEHAAKKFAANQLGTHRESADQLETTTAISNHLGIVNTFA